MDLQDRTWPKLRPECGLAALRFIALTGQRAHYSWARVRVRTLLGIGEAGGGELRVGQ
jgi:hypothetical protein